MKKKKVLLIYSESKRNSDLKLISKILDNILHTFNIECTIDTCTLFRAKEKLDEGYDIVAGYHIDIQHELSLSDKFEGRYLHFFDNQYTFAFATVTKKKEMGGYNTYSVKPVSVN